MAIQKINLGTEPHGVGGDSYRTANEKINSNFEEVGKDIKDVLDVVMTGDFSKTAYDIAVKNGFVGSESEWLESLRGEQGPEAKSVYDIAVSHGFKGNEKDWLNYILENSETVSDLFSDADSLEQFVNGSEDETVLTRLSAEYPTLQKALKELFENGGIADRFKTLADLQASPLVDGDYALVADDTAGINGIYIKTDGVWVRSKYDPVLKSSAMASVYTDLAVDALSDEILDKSYNLYNHKTITAGVVIDVSGNITPNAGYSITDYITVNPNQPYLISGDNSSYAFTNIAYYDEKQVFIKRDSAPSTAGGAMPLAIPSNTRYIRFSFQGTALARNKMFIQGSTPLPYQAYYSPRLINNKLSDDLISNIKSNIIGYDFVNKHVITSTNLYDKDSITTGFVIGASGNYVANASYAYSDFIEVDPATRYTASASDNRFYPFISAAYYDLEKNFIYRADLASGDKEVQEITTHPSASYVRLNINPYTSDTGRVFAKGDVALDYEPYGTATLKDIKFSDDIIDSIDSKINLTNSNPIMYDLPVTGVFSTDEVWSQFPPSTNDIPSKPVYDLYDALAAEHPEYVTVQELGNDALGNRIACYKFVNPKPSTDIQTKYPKIFLACGLHGNEHVQPISTYLLMEQLCNNWRKDPLLEVMRFNCDILVIPVANPSGFAANSRKNHNGVDINRNFPALWINSDPSLPTHGGTSPASELETQYIMQVFEENPDIDAYYDCHNFHERKANAEYIWVVAQKGNKHIVERLAQSLIGRMSRKWRREYDWMPQNNDYSIGYTDSGTYEGMSVTYATSRGIKVAATLEVCLYQFNNPSPTRFDALHNKTAVETLANTILLTMQEIASIYKIPLGAMT